MLAIHNRFGWISRRMQCAGSLGSLWLVLCTVGCSICPSPYDYDYGTYGTKTPRTNMRHGRVGSILSEGVYGASQDVSSQGMEIDAVVIDQGYIEELPGELYSDEMVVEPGPIRSGEIIIQ